MENMKRSDRNILHELRDSPRWFKTTLLVSGVITSLSWMSILSSNRQLERIHEDRMTREQTAERITKLHAQYEKEWEEHLNGITSKKIEQENSVQISESSSSK